jgi:2'-5' RNA ligase
MISDFRSELKDERIKWTDTGNFHITIAFLGDTDEGRVPDIAAMLGEVCKGIGNFDLVLNGAGVFRNLSDPRILWTGTEPSDKLTEIYHSVKNGLHNITIPFEDHGFNPHLTLGRIKNISDTGRLKSLIEKHNGISVQKQAIRSVILYESILSQYGPTYKPLGEYPLV